MMLFSLACARSKFDTYFLQRNSSDGQHWRLIVREFVRDFHLVEVETHRPVKLEVCRDDVSVRDRTGERDNPGRVVERVIRVRWGAVAVASVVWLLHTVVVNLHRVRQRVAFEVKHEARDRLLDRTRHLVLAHRERVNLLKLELSLHSVANSDVASGYLVIGWVEQPEAIRRTLSRVEHREQSVILRCRLVLEADVPACTREWPVGVALLVAGEGRVDGRVVSWPTSCHQG